MILQKDLTTNDFKDLVMDSLTFKLLLAFRTKRMILIWPKRAKAGAVCIAYSAKNNNEKKNTNHREVDLKER